MSGHCLPSSLTPPTEKHSLNMSNVARLRKLSNLAHTMFEENFTGRNAVRKMLIPEMNSAVLIAACKFADVAKVLAHYSDAAWSKTSKFNTCKVTNEIMQMYDTMAERWREEKLKERHGRVFPRLCIINKSGYKAILDEEVQLMRSILDYTKLAEGGGPLFSARAATMAADIVVHIAALVARLIAWVDKEYAATVQPVLSMAIINSARETVVALASNKQKSEILKMLKNGKKFASSAVTAMEAESVYVIHYDGAAVDNFCGFVITNQAVHMPAGGNKDVVITYVETMQGHRRSMIAKRLLTAIRIIAQHHGYHSLYALTMYPNLMFWKKCGFEPRLNGKRNQLAFCCLNKMSLHNILN